MKVIVRLGEPIWRAVGQRRVEVEVPGSSCSPLELVRRLETAYPALRGELRGASGGNGADGLDWHFTFFLQDRIVKPADLAAERVGDGDEVMLVLPTAGG
jgi:hypothetical protein